MPFVLARLVGNQVQLGLHAGHGVDPAAQLRDEEGVHHGVGGHPEVDRGVDREGQLVDRRNAQLRIDEQPLPVQGNDIHLNRFDVRFQRLVGVEGGEVFQVITARMTMMMTGTVQTTASILLEWAQSGA